MCIQCRTGRVFIKVFIRFIGLLVRVSVKFSFHNYEAELKDPAQAGSFVFPPLKNAERPKIFAIFAL